MTIPTQTITPTDEAFPDSLRHIDPKPVQLYQKGEYDPDLVPISIVGSRKHTAYGTMVTEAIVEHLARYPVCIVSGLALGIDSIAHRAALKHNLPTVAFLPGGIEKVYPASHQSLARTIIERGGALMSEYGGSEKAFKQHFHERNRLISGMSVAVIVIEAAERSGTLITARYALEQGKELIAVPGAVNAPTSKGTNTLIKSGSHIMTEPRDITDILGLKTTAEAERIYEYTSPEERSVHELLLRNACSGDEIMKRLELEHRHYLQLITMLEIKGYVHPLGADRWSGR